jgi:hypothetical protein
MDGSHQLTDPAGLGDGSKMRGPYRWDSAPQMNARIAGRSAGQNRKSKYARAIGARPVGGLAESPIDDLAQGVEYLHC